MTITVTVHCRRAGGGRAWERGYHSLTPTVSYTHLYLAQFLPGTHYQTNTVHANK